MKILALCLAAATAAAQQEVHSTSLWTARSAGAERSAIVLPGDIVLPQVANGGGWSTTFVFTNLSSTDTEGFTVAFWDDSGRSLGLGFFGVVGYSISVQPLRPGGVAVIETDGAGSLQQGWAELIPNTKDAKVRIGGMGVFRQRVPGRQDAEAVVPLSSLIEKQVVLIYDNVNNFATGAALVNGAGSQSTITATIRDGEGRTISTETFTMASGHHLAFQMAQRFPATANRRGSVVFATSGNALSALGLRFSPSGSFTSFPPLTTSQLLGIQ